MVNRGRNYPERVDILLPRLCLSFATISPEKRSGSSTKCLNWCRQLVLLANSERYTEPGLHTNVDHLIWWEECRIGAGSAGLLTAQASWQKTPDLVPINEANVSLLSAIAYSDTRYGSVANGHLRSPSPRFARKTPHLLIFVLAKVLLAQVSGSSGSI